MKNMRVILSLLALTGTVLGNSHNGKYLVDKNCWDNGTDSKGNNVKTLAGVKKHSTKCLDMCLSGGSNFVLLKYTAGATPEMSVDQEIATAKAGGQDNATVVAIKALLADSNCNNDWEVIVTGGTTTPAQGNGNDMWEIGNDGAIVRHVTCAVKEGWYYLIDNACWNAGTDMNENDLKTLAGIKKHTTSCIKAAGCYKSGYVMVQADANDVVTKKYSVKTGTCSDSNQTSSADCETAQGQWSFSADEKALQAKVDAFDAAGCKDDIKMDVQDVTSTTTVSNMVVEGANFDLTCAPPTPATSGAAVASLAGLLVGALLL